MRKILLIAFLTVATLTTYAHFSIHSATSGVKVESGGQQCAATKGNAVKATDYLIIPAGGEVEIYNDLDKRIYRSVTTGKMSVTRLMMDAKKIASNNNQSVGSRLNVGGGKKSASARVYDETGMVTRDVVYADNMPLPNVAHGDIDGKGLYYKVTDDVEGPLYFNAFRYAVNEEGQYVVSLSPLGQQESCYTILPQQTLTRENLSDLPAGETHYLVVSYAPFDNEEMISQLNGIIKEGKAIEKAGPELSIFIIKL